VALRFRNSFQAPLLPANLIRRRAGNIVRLLGGGVVNLFDRKSEFNVWEATKYATPIVSNNCIWREQQ
jgi:hypothetical protein